MMDMIEKVAMAIAHGRDGSKPETYDQFADMIKEDLRRQARAAIMALREPTSDMVEAFIQTAAAQGVAFEEDSPPQYPVPIYRAMIDVALK